MFLGTVRQEATRTPLERHLNHTETVRLSTLTTLIILRDTKFPKYWGQLREFLELSILACLGKWFGKISLWKNRTPENARGALTTAEHNQAIRRPNGHY
jgi:hypothetical protein